MLLQKFPKHFFVNFGLFQMSLKDGQKILLQKFSKTIFTIKDVPDLS